MWKKILLSALTIAIILLTGILPSIFLEATPSIEYVKPKYEAISEKLNCDGIIEAINTSEIYLQTPVIANEVNISIGDYVSEGDLLAVIDTELTKSVLTGAETVGGGNNSSFQLGDLSELRDMYTMAEMAGINIAKLIEQYQNSSYKEMNNNSPLYIIEELIAPISGVVTEVNIRENVLSKNQSPTITIVDNSRYKVVAQINQSDVDRVTVGMKAKVSFNEHYYDAVITKIYPTAKRSSSISSKEAEVSLELELLEVDERIKAGYNVSVSIILSEDERTVMLPFEAIMQDEQNMEYVYILNGSQTIRRDIKTGQETAEGVEVIEGLTEEDIVVYQPYDKVDGERIIYIKGEASLDR